MSQEQPLDFRGTVIEVGMELYYPTRQGSSMNMRHGTVKAIVKQEKYGAPWRFELECDATDWVAGKRVVTGFRRVFFESPCRAIAIQESQ